MASKCTQKCVELNKFTTILGDTSLPLIHLSNTNNNNKTQTRYQRLIYKPAQSSGAVIEHYPQHLHTRHSA